MIGKLIGVAESNRDLIVSIAVRNDAQTKENISKLVGQEVNADITKFDADHSPNQRKYFHKLCVLYSQKVNQSFYAVKNKMICTYGQIARLDDGNPIVLKINVEPEQVVESATNHLKFIKYENGGYFYQVRKGTADLTVSEYNELIDGTIYECRTEGIQTDTPAELARLKELWRK